MAPNDLTLFLIGKRYTDRLNTKLRLKERTTTNSRCTPTSATIDCLRTNVESRTKRTAEIDQTEEKEGGIILHSNSHNRQYSDATHRRDRFGR